MRECTGEDSCDNIYGGEKSVSIDPWVTFGEARLSLKLNVDGASKGQPRMLGVRRFGT